MLRPSFSTHIRRQQGHQAPSLPCKLLLGPLLHLGPSRNASSLAIDTSVGSCRASKARNTSARITRAQSSTNAGMSGPHTQVLSFTNSHNELLAAKFVDAGSDSIVILCHGYAATKDGFLFPRLADALAARGRSSLRFDFAGNGESQGVFSFGNYYREVEDLRSAVLFVRDVLKKNVSAIVGHSKGGNVVLLYASRYDDVPTVINIAGRGIMSRGIKERFGSNILDRIAVEGAVEQEVKADGGRRIRYLLTKESVDERMQLDMLAEASKISAKVLTIHGSSDTVIPVGDAHELGVRIRSHQLFVVEGADHNFRQPEAAVQLMRRVTDYLTS